MAELLDLRRTDERNTYLQHPIWVESGPITKECDDKAAILFSFPAVKYKGIIIHEVYTNIITAFTGGTITLSIGTHTIATDAAVTGDTATVVDVDDYMVAADIADNAVGINHPSAGDFADIKAAGTSVSPKSIVPADTTVPCITATLTGDSVITDGEARFYALITFIMA